ncbi:uncharacterized protein M421DRAFT_416897 [Didymella exigua CBS 183.55]|uniref:Borealin N-terminal domain-containing protein n=1 Tax=Didymella exigua CBS 183.55 TaxID=1150837 RepID=A0A6A5RXU5_9PLEO|nr:uncharacterized protein M421DRAFT_416897 [Didymella exigua CBS 183.55]KAF1932170.1 hypothetical protein M421DRAFT_416897 [Didymella exigua CBS 183.55]
MVAPITEEAKAAMLANFELEFNARKEKLRAMCEAQCASLRSRLERRVNRVPATKRHMPLIELLAPPPPPAAKPAPAPTKAATTKKAPTKKAAPASVPVHALAPPAKIRAAAATTTASRPTTVKAAPAPKPTTKSRHAPSKSVPTTSTRGKKRSSDEATSEDKENVSIDLAVPKKRVRAATTVSKQPVVPKPAAPAARSTRAASRKTAPAEVLSPKNNNTRAKPSTRSVRPR